MKIAIDSKNEILSTLKDPAIPASLLKSWFRDLPEPVIPNNRYQECLDSSSDAEKSIAIIDSLPADYRILMYFIINFLQKFTKSDIETKTLMSAEVCCCCCDCCCNCCCC